MAPRSGPPTNRGSPPKQHPGTDEPGGQARRGVHGGPRGPTWANQTNAPPPRAPDIPEARDHPPGTQGALLCRWCSSGLGGARCVGGVRGGGGHLLVVRVRVKGGAHGGGLWAVALSRGGGGGGGRLWIGRARMWIRRPGEAPRPRAAHAPPTHGARTHAANAWDAGARPRPPRRPRRTGTPRGKRAARGPRPRPRRRQKRRACGRGPGARVPRWCRRGTSNRPPRRRRTHPPRNAHSRARRRAPSARSARARHPWETPWMPKSSSSSSLA